MPSAEELDLLVQRVVDDVLSRRFRGKSWEDHVREARTDVEQDFFVADTSGLPMVPPVGRSFRRRRSSAWAGVDLRLAHFLLRSLPVKERERVLWRPRHAEPRLESFDDSLW